jgi:hypothetical protein
VPGAREDLPGRIERRHLSRARVPSRACRHRDNKPDRDGGERDENGNSLVNASSCSPSFGGCACQHRRIAGPGVKKFAGAPEPTAEFSVR